MKLLDTARSEHCKTCKLQRGRSRRGRSKSTEGAAKWHMAIFSELYLYSQNILLNFFCESRTIPCHAFQKKQSESSSQQNIRNDCRIGGQLAQKTVLSTLLATGVTFWRFCTARTAAPILAFKQIYVSHWWEVRFIWICKSENTLEKQLSMFWLVPHSSKVMTVDAMLRQIPCIHTHHLESRCPLECVPLHMWNLFAPNCVEPINRRLTNLQQKRLRKKTVRLRTHLLTVLLSTWKKYVQGKATGWNHRSYLERTKQKLWKGRETKGRSQRSDRGKSDRIELFCAQLDFESFTKWRQADASIVLTGKTKGSSGLGDIGSLFIFCTCTPFCLNWAAWCGYAQISNWIHQKKFLETNSYLSWILTSFSPRECNPSQDGIFCFMSVCKWHGMLVDVLFLQGGDKRPAGFGRFWLFLMVKNFIFHACQQNNTKFHEHHACHGKTHLNFTKDCTCHKKFHLNFLKRCTCPSTKNYTCHEKWLLNLEKYYICYTLIINIKFVLCLKYN